MRTFRSSLLAAVAAAILASCSNAQTAATSTHRFESNVRAYETADKTNTPPQGAILLAGDSQFFRWKTYAEDLAGYTVVDRGIDSFEASDLIYFADRLVLPYKPRLIVVNVGGNDVHNHKSAEQVLADFKTFVAKVRVTMPTVPIVFSGITPCPERWPEAEQRKQANEVVKAYVATQPGLLFVDQWDAMLTPDGKPREDLWGPDRIHSNHEGYLIRARLLIPLLGAPDKKDK